MILDLEHVDGEKKLVMELAFSEKIQRYRM